MFNMVQYDNTNTDLNNNLQTLLQLAEKNMKAIRYETENIYSSQINQDSPYQENNVSNWEENIPKDLANWSDDPNYKNYWAVNPRDIANWQDEYEQKQNQLPAFQIEDFHQPKPPIIENPKRIQRINHQNGVVLRDSTLKKPQNGVIVKKEGLIKHQNGGVLRDEVLNNLLQKTIKGDTSFLGDPLNRNWTRKYARDSIQACARCSKDVFPTESIRFDGKTWHTWCIKCRQCWLTLDQPDAIKIFRGDVYCNRCHDNMILTTTSQSIPIYNQNKPKIDGIREYKNATAQRFHNGEINEFGRRYSDDYRFRGQLFTQEHIYENQDAIVINSHHNPPNITLKGILKQNKALPPPPPEYLSLNKQFMHPLSQTLMEEIENKSIKYDNTEDSRHLIENDRVLVNMKNKQYHPSIDESHGINGIYESVLGTARDKWIEEYGVPDKNKTNSVENLKDDLKRSSFVDRDYRVPSYSVHSPEAEVDALRNDSNQTNENYYDNSNMEGNTEVFRQKSDVRGKSVETKRESQIEKREQNVVEKNDDEMTRSGQQEGTTKGTRHLDNLQRTDDFISSNVVRDEKFVENQKAKQKLEDKSTNIHPSNMKGSESAYSKSNNKKKKSVSFKGPSSKTTLPRLIEFKLSSKNRFYISKVQKSRQKIQTKNIVTNNSEKSEELPDQNNQIDHYSTINDHKDKHKTQEDQHVILADKEVELKTHNRPLRGWKKVKQYLDEGKLTQAYLNKDHNPKHRPRSGWNKVKHCLDEGKLTRSYLSNGHQYIPESAPSTVDDNYVDDFKPDIQLLRTNQRYDPETIMERNSQKYAKKTSKKESKSFFRKFIKDKKSAREYDVKKASKKFKNTRTER